MSSNPDALVVTMPLPPMGKPRPRVTRGGKHTHNPENYRRWLAAAQLYITSTMRQLGWTAPEGPVRLDVAMAKPRPKRKPRGGWHPAENMPGLSWAPVKPDADNAAGAVMDALTKAGAYRDDSQVVELRSRTLYSDDRKAWIVLTLEEVAP